MVLNLIHPAFLADKSSVIELCLKHKRGCVWGALLALLDFYKRQSEG
jgi:hypothetical protein